MSIRRHFTQADAVGVRVIDSFEELEDEFGEQSAYELGVPVLAIDDGGNCEQMVLAGCLRDISDLGLRIYGASRQEPWDNDFVQFARLLAEINATQDLDLDALCESMDLEPALIDDLFDRADHAWEQAKGNR